MAPPIVDVNDAIVFVNSPISASDLFTVNDDPNFPVVSYRFEDFHSLPNTGYFALGRRCLLGGGICSIYFQVIINL